MRKNALGIPGIDMFKTSRKIGELIDKSVYSDKELSEILGLSVQAVNKWRHGRNLPDLENLFILSKLFGIPMDAFLVAADEEALQKLVRRAGVKLAEASCEAGKMPVGKSFDTETTDRRQERHRKRPPVLTCFPPAMIRRIEAYRRCGSKVAG